MNPHWNSHLNRHCRAVTAAGRAAPVRLAVALGGVAGRQDYTRRRSLGAGLPVRWRSNRRTSPPAPKRVIFLFMHGGPSQVDTFDLQTTA